MFAPNIVIIGQNGRLSFEALLFVASLKYNNPAFSGRIFVGEPQPNDLWESDPRINNPDICAALERLGAEILPFENKHFGEKYPYGNKIEVLEHLPEGEPFIFFDSDTLITGDLTQAKIDFERPCASLKVEGTWPKPTLYGAGYTEMWKSLYTKFDIEFESSLDMSQPDEYWRRYLYFNAGFFFYKCPKEFGSRFLKFALEIRDTPPKEVATQVFDPWLDQIALPLVIHSLGGARDTLAPNSLDGDISCHYRMFPLLYARESDHVVEQLHKISEPNWLKKTLKQHDPIKRMVYQSRGMKLRALFDRDNLPHPEKKLRNQIKQAGFWMR